MGVLYWRKTVVNFCAHWETFYTLIVISRFSLGPDCRPHRGLFEIQTTIGEEKSSHEPYVTHGGDTVSPPPPRPFRAAARTRAFGADAGVKCACLHSPTPTQLRQATFCIRFLSGAFNQAPSFATDGLPLRCSDSLPPKPTVRRRRRGRRLPRKCGSPTAPAAGVESQRADVYLSCATTTYASLCAGGSGHFP